ncbi:MAG: hypothetical protein ACM3SY_16795 [Candidatus Omnitrophota bacterium]
MTTASKKEIERIGFGVTADSDEYAPYLHFSDRILVKVFENRKTVIQEEYFSNPYAKELKEKFPKPSALGDSIPDDEMELLTKTAKFFKEQCNVKYLYGKHITYFLRVACERAGQYFSTAEVSPQKIIERFIDARTLAGFRD